MKDKLGGFAGLSAFLPKGNKKNKALVAGSGSGSDGTLASGSKRKDTNPYDQVLGITSKSNTGTINADDTTRETKTVQLDDSENNPDSSVGLANASSLDRLPVNAHVKWKAHDKAISCLHIESSGSRMLTGDYGMQLKLWDFNGMNNALKPFRTVTPWEGYALTDAKFSPKGDAIIVCSGSHSAKLYNRDGIDILEYIKGDPYIRDMRHTKGHVAALTSCCWHPKEKDIFITSSMDGTVRTWYADDKRKQMDVISCQSRTPGSRTGVTAALYSPDGKSIFAATNDGYLRSWSSKGPFIRPAMEIKNAHMQGATISSIAVHQNTLLSRAMDDTFKVWDVRQTTKPLHSFTNLENAFEETSCGFSPDGQFIYTGTSSRKDEGAGKLVVFGRKTCDLVYEHDYVGTSAIASVWHPRLQQIFIGLGNGDMAALYDEEKSFQGMKLCANKVHRPKADAFYNASKDIIAPHTLSSFKDNRPRSNKRRREKDRMDPIKSHRPELPHSGPGKGGRVGSNMTQHIMKNIVKDTTRDEDPREALLKYSKEAEENPMWVDHAYKKTQPNRIFDENEYEETEAPRRK